MKHQTKRKIVWLICIYGGVTVALTAPVFWQLNSTVAGFAGRDSFQHVWYQWWLKDTLLDLAVWPDQVSQLYHPLGASHPVLALHPYVPLVSLPLTLFFGPLISYNLAFLSSFILSGLMGFLLCRYVSGHFGAALLGGLIFAFYPNRFGHAAAGHLLLITNYFLPLYALALLLLLRRPSLKLAVLYGTVTALLALAQPTHVGYGIIPIFLVLAGAWFVPFSPSPQPSPLRRGGFASPSVGRIEGGHFASTPHRLRWLIVAHLIALALFLPFAWSTLSQNQQGGLAYLTPDDLTKHSTDLLAFVLPSPYNPILAAGGLIPGFSPTIIDGPRDLEEQLAYPGLIALLLSGLAVVTRWRRAGAWLGLTLLAGVLSLGPLLKIGGEIQGLTLPYTWLTYLPFFAWSRTPGRFNETFILGIAVLASLGAAWLFEWIKMRQSGSQFGYQVSLWGISLLLLLELIVILPFPTETRPISPYYAQLAGGAAEQAILEVPVTGSRRASNYAMYYQTVHEHNLAGGYIERDPPGTVELKEFLNQLISPVAPQSVIPVPDEAQRRAILRDMGIAQVIAHPALMTDQAARQTKEYLPTLFGPVLYEDEETQVYPIPAETEGVPAWQLLPDQENWEVLQDGGAFRLKKEGYFFIYAADAGSVNLILRTEVPPPTQLVWQLNDTPLEPYNLGITPLYESDPLPLQKGLNYFWLTTDPPRDVDFNQISLRMAGGNALEGGD